MYDKIIDMYCLTGKLPNTLVDKVCISAHQQIVEAVSTDEFRLALEASEEELFIIQQSNEFTRQWLEMFDEIIDNLYS